MRCTHFHVNGLKRLEVLHGDVHLVYHPLSIMILDLHNKVARLKVQYILGVMVQDLLVPIGVDIPLHHHS